MYLINQMYVNVAHYNAAEVLNVTGCAIRLNIITSNQGTWDHSRVQNLPALASMKVVPKAPSVA